MVTQVGPNVLNAEESSLSSWAGPYVTEMLGRGQALAGLPYQPYMGPLTAGASPLQQQAFQGLGALQMPTSSQMSYTPMSFTGSSFAQPMGQQGMGGYREPTAAEQARMDQRSRANARPVPTMEEMARQMATDLPILPSEAQRPAINPTGAQPIPTPEGRTYVNEPFFANQEDYEAWKASGADTKLDLPSMLRNAMAQGRGDTFDDMGMTFDPVTKTITSTGTGQVSEGYPSQAQRQAQIQAPAMPQAQPQAQPSATSILEQYMSPYLQGALDPQYAAAQRQADIAAQNLQSQFGKAGAYGGSRQGVAEAELQRGLLDRMAGITGTGYQQAFEQAQRQFNTEQDRQMAATGQAQRYGLDVLGAQQTGGGLQRAIESQGIAADLAQFEQERDYPYKQVQFMQSLLQGLPLETQSYSYYEPSGLQSLQGAGSDILSILDLLSGKS